MIEVHEINLQDTFYSTSEEKAEVLQKTITSVLEFFKDTDEQVLESFIHFCNTGKFLDELDS